MESSQWKGIHRLQDQFTRYYTSYNWQSTKYRISLRPLQFLYQEELASNGNDKVDKHFNWARWNIQETDHLVNGVEVRKEKHSQESSLVADVFQRYITYSLEDNLHNKIISLKDFSNLNKLAAIAQSTCSNCLLWNGCPELEGVCLWNRSSCSRLDTLMVITIEDHHSKRKMLLTCGNYRKNQCLLSKQG